MGCRCRGFPGPADARLAACDMRHMGGWRVCVGFSQSKCEMIIYREKPKKLTGKSKKVQKVCKHDQNTIKFVLD